MFDFLPILVNDGTISLFKEAYIDKIQGTFVKSI